MIDPGELAGSIRDLVRWAYEHAPDPEPELTRRLREFLGVDPSGLEIVASELTSYDHPNFQVALDAFVQESGDEPDLVGIPTDGGWQTGLAEVANSKRLGMALEPGPVSYAPSTSAIARSAACSRR